MGLPMGDVQFWYCSRFWLMSAISGFAAIDFWFSRRGEKEVKWGRVGLKKTTKCCYKLPPGPPGLPIFGNMFELGTEPYKKMSVLKQKYGPVLWLKLGTSTNIMVVQTAQAAAELFKNHDTSFADRPLVDVNSAHNYWNNKDPK
ncbi:hypothetical protein MTR67_045801 [Solanum verrucosum]|uniref:Cytochrome P450 n=1 Tax=Solanum verrucosum TaxID=315347 RepID=A0AAF0UW71_SOLVR|nr:hypothetical protein MTR67_045801 [Solanum verrucosum]